MSMKRYFLHFKGGIYQIICIAADSETLEQMVVYQASYGENRIWVRSFAHFFGKVTCNHQEVDRFKEITEEEMLCLSQVEKKNI